MKKKEVKGIGGFLLVYILIEIIYLLLSIFMISKYYDNYNVAIYYMPWMKKSIDFVYIFTIIMNIVAAIHVLMLLFIRKKIVISFTINLYIFYIISSILMFIIFNDIFFINFSNIDFSNINIKYFVISIVCGYGPPIGVIMYFKKSERVKNTYCENMNREDSEYIGSRDIHSEKDRHYYYSNWQQFTSKKDFFTTSQDNYDEKYHRSNWQNFSKENVYSGRTSQQADANKQKVNSQYRSTQYKQNNGYQQSNNSEQKTNNSYKESYENKLPNDVIMAFKVFDMPIVSSFEVIKKKYHLLIKIYHPDKNNGDEETTRYAEQKTKEINMAYSILKTYFSQKR